VPVPDRQDEFLGYRRSDGRVGTRNHLLVLSINGLVAPAARRLARQIAGARLVATPYGRGQFGPDADAQRAQLVGLGRNPNVGAVLVVGADRRSVDAIAQAIAATGKPVETVALDDVGEDALALSERGVRSAARLAREVSRARRETVPLASLFLGLECGHSDATSGLIANPLAGRIADRVVDGGGTAVFGETLEWLGAEHLLAQRAATREIGTAIVGAVARREAAVAAAGIDLLGNNPGDENIRGGLSTIEEKSLGGIAKGGTRPIRSVLKLAEAPAGPGLHVMDAPGFSPESLTGFAAAGAALMLFTTGAGNSFCNLLAPTIKISGHPQAAAALGHQIDFDASAAFAGREDLDAAAERLFRLVLEVTSGTLTWGEVLDETDETFVRLGPSL
jgi:altronate dehydratase large subunit